MTNADRIRSMTDEELAEWLCEHVDCGEGCPNFHGYMCTRDCGDCEVGLLDWLKQEVADND